MIEYKVTVYFDRTIWYNLDGKLHREDGPAFEWANGAKGWYLNGKPHRTDGPAVECEDGSKEWWVDGKQLTEEEFNLQMNLTPDPCDGKVIEIEGKKYKLTGV